MALIREIGDADYEAATAATRSANPAMIRVNGKLGFQRGPSEVRLVRVIGASCSAAFLKV
ncbi:MAG TPA: hypothetical protein VFU22_19615 [Roseiflexaceae bacterium]|nr:hypothetical protein [Roseiflexaceae bacterium]